MQISQSVRVKAGLRNRVTQQHVTVIADPVLSMDVCVAQIGKSKPKRRL
jgi:hypothetical protein